MKKISGDWTLTQLIEYHNVLPYAGIMASWFARQFPLLSSELINVPEYEKLDSKSVDSSHSEMVDVDGRSAENLEFGDNNINYDFPNAKFQKDASEKSYTRTQSKGDSTDVQFEKTYDDDNLAKSKSTERRGDYDNGPESKNVERRDVNLGSKPSGSEALSHRNSEELVSVNVIESNKYSFENANGQEDSCKKWSMTMQREVDRDVESERTCNFENLPKSKSCDRKSDNRNGSRRENVKGLDVNLSGMLSGTETLHQSSKEETMDINGIELKKSVLLSDKEAIVQTSSNEGAFKEAEQPSAKVIQPFIEEVDGEEIISINSGVEKVSTVNNFEKLAKEVKDLLKSHDAAETSLTCKREILQLELGGPYVDDNQESSGSLTNEVNSTTMSLSGDANAESELKSDNKIANKEDLKLCKSDSRCESNSDLLCSRKDLQLKSGYIDEENIIEEGNLPYEVGEVSANLISQTNNVRVDKPDLDLSNQKTSKCRKMDSSLQNNVSVHIEDFASSPLGKGSEESHLTCRKEKDEILGTKAVIVYHMKRKRSRNQNARAPTGCCANTELETAKSVNSCNADFRDKIATNHAIMPFNLCTPVINPAEPGHSATNNLLSVLTSKETELSEAALGVLLQKKRELCHQQQEIQDQITLCDQSIQNILDGNENSSVLKLDTIIKCCNDFLNNKTEVQCDSYNQAANYNALQLPRLNSISKPFLLTGSASQKLDNSNANICALAGQFMSSSTGNFVGGVAAGEKDLKRESAAADESRPLKTMLEQAP